MKKSVNTGQKQKKDTKFKPGQSGNPAGKPSGARHKTTIAAQALLDGEGEAFDKEMCGARFRGQYTRFTAMS